MAGFGAMGDVKVDVGGAVEVDDEAEVNAESGIWVDVSGVGVGGAVEVAVDDDAAESGI